MDEQKEELKIGEVKLAIEVYILRIKIIKEYGFDSVIYHDFDKFCITMWNKMNKPTYAKFIEEFDKLILKK